MDYKALKSIIEGLLFLSGDEGISIRQVAEITEQRPELAASALEELKDDYVSEGRGLQVVQIAGNYRLATLPEHAQYFERLAYSPSRSTLSQAALETLAIVAYRQPITRVEIEEIRGVKSKRAIHTLNNKDLIHDSGSLRKVLGRLILYGTTKSFLENLGLASLKELPEPTSFESSDNLEEETQLLFNKLDTQMTFEDIQSSDS